MRNEMQILTIGPKATEADVKRWRKTLEGLGLEGVRSRLMRTTSLDLNEMVEIDEEWGPPRKFVEDWLTNTSAREQRRETRRFWIMVVIGTIAAVASCVAAWPVVEPFIRR